MRCRFRNLLSIFAVTCALVSLSGCASLGKQLKAWISGKEVSENPQVRTVTTPRFSEQENIRVNSDRQYRRMNRQKFEDDAEVQEGAGSLWVMEGQGAYLFSQNQMRMVGDLLNVRIEGGPRTQLQTKTRVISKLLERLENPQRGLASQAANGASGAQPPNGAPQAPGGAQATANPAGQQGDQKGSGGDSPGEAQAARADGPFNVQTVPTRIVEQLKDGSYRVRGMQPFMIGKREYKVIVTGVVRPEDFDDAGIDAGKLLDPQFDIVSSRKGASL